ncbi:hypothetical protein SLA2020_030300 [Shorea laevis]
MKLTPSHFSSSFLHPFFTTNFIIIVNIYLRRDTFTVRATHNKFEQKKLYVNIEMISHVDHGKTIFITTLTMTLTFIGNSTFKKYDRINIAIEERAHGTTINIATVEYKIDSCHYAHVDCLGHVDYVKNMIIGAAQMNGAILVFLRVDGPMP